MGSHYLFFRRFLGFIVVRVKIVGDIIPNAMQEVRRYSQWRRATIFLVEITSERESKLKGP